MPALVLSVIISFFGTLFIIKNPDMIWYPASVPGIKEHTANLAILQVTAFIVLANLSFVALSRIIIKRNFSFLNKVNDLVRMIAIAVIPVYVSESFFKAQHKAS